MTYSLEDYPSYLKYNLEKVFNETDLVVKQLIKKYQSIDELALKVNSDSATLNHKVPNSTKVNYTSTIYHNFVLQLPTLMQVIQQKPISEIRRDLNDTAINKFDSNVLYDMLYTSRLHGREMTASVSEDDEELNFIARLFLLLFILIIIVFLQASIIMDRQQVNFLWYIYGAMQSLNMTDISERTLQLRLFEQELRLFQKDNYSSNFMDSPHLQIEERDTYKNNKKLTRFKEKIYCFGIGSSLCTSLFLTISLSFGTLLFTLLLLSQLNSIKIVSSKQLLVSKVIGDSISQHNVILGCLENKGPVKYVNKMLNVKGLITINARSQKGSQLFETLNTSENSIIGRQSTTWIKDTLTRSICDEDNIFKVRKELCVNLDSKIPEKGINQAVFRNQQILSSLVRELIDSKFKMDASDFLNREEYINWEYTFDLMYMPSLINLRDRLSQSLNDMTENYDDIILIVEVISHFCILSLSYLIYRAYHRSVASTKQAAFCFQLLSINTILDNLQVKIRFLRVFGIDFKQF